MTFGPFLMQERLDAELTREALAERCAIAAPRVPGITEASIRFWELEQHNRIPSAAQLETLAVVFGWDDAKRGTALRLAKERTESRRAA